MAGSELQILSIRVDDIDGGEIPMSGMQRDGKSLDTQMSRGYFLDPHRVMAAMSLMTEQHRLRVEQLQWEYRGRPAGEYVQAVSDYLVETLGIENIEARYELMMAGEYPWPPLPFG